MPLGPAPTALDYTQVLTHAFDESTGRLRVDGFGGGALSHTTSSVALGDGTNLLTSTTVGGDIGLDVNIINSALTMDIVHTGDSVRLGDGTSFLTSTTVGGDIGLDTYIINDLNYGTVGAATVRTAAQIGNATGAAAFNAGTTTAQTLRVVLPTDQTSIPVTQSGTWNITNISGTVSLPTGAATAANQATEISSLSSIDTKLTTTNASLATIDAGIPAALGQAAMAASMPVVIASNQSNVPVSIADLTIATAATATSSITTTGTVIAFSNIRAARIAPAADSTAINFLWSLDTSSGPTTSTGESVGTGINFNSTRELLNFSIRVATASSTGTLIIHTWDD